MKKIFVEFEIHDSMLNDEFETRKRSAIKNVIEEYMIKIKVCDKYNSLFNKKIAFELHEKRYSMDDKMMERIELEPISINTIEYIPKIEPYSMYKKYSFKERLKILFTGRLNK